MLDEVDGQDVPPTGSIRLMNSETAAKLRDMMKLTVSQGTATSSFVERHRMSLGDRKDGLALHAHARSLQGLLLVRRFRADGRPQGRGRRGGGG